MQWLWFLLRSFPNDDSFQYIGITYEILIEVIFVHKQKQYKQSVSMTDSTWHTSAYVLVSNVCFFFQNSGE